MGDELFCDVCGCSAPNLRSPIEVCRDCYDIGRGAYAAVVRIDELDGAALRARVAELEEERALEQKASELQGRSVTEVARRCIVAEARIAELEGRLTEWDASLVKIADLTARCARLETELCEAEKRLSQYVLGCACPGMPCVTACVECDKTQAIINSARAARAKEEQKT